MKSIILPVVVLLGGLFAAMILVAQDPPVRGSRVSDVVAKRQTPTESMRTQWQTAKQIESMRRGEYRRLLGL